MGGCKCRVCPVLVWHYIDIFVFSYCNYMAIASVVLYFLKVVHLFFLRSLRYSIVIWYWILRIFDFFKLLCCVC
jgi:hypothetical protein